MAAFRGDFDGFPDDDDYSRPLPPEDRLWRHPSELGAANASLPLDPVAVRRRWLNQQPTRASAWTAGLVGAILATGLVALGTHLAGAFTSNPVPRTSATALPPSSEIALAPRLSGLGPTITQSITRVGAAVAAIEVIQGGLDRHCLGLVVRSDGTVVAPASVLRGATTMLVTLPNSVSEVAHVVSTDPRSGLALLRVNGASNVRAISFDQTGTIEPQSLALVVGYGGSYALGSLQSLDMQASVAGSALADVVRTDIPAADAAPGSALVDPNGTVLGIVAGSVGGDAVAVPSWVAAPVITQLLGSGSVGHGTLGIQGRTVPQEGFQPAGVQLTRVTPGSAAGVAGLRTGDIITSVNFQRVTSLVGLRGHLYGVAPGAPVLVGIDRGTTELFYRVYLQRGARG